MGKLGHVAITVPAIEVAVNIYGKTFEMRRVWKRDLAIMPISGIAHV